MSNAGETLGNVFKGVINIGHGIGEAIRGNINQGVDTAGQGLSQRRDNKRIPDEVDAEHHAYESRQQEKNQTTAQGGINEVKQGINQIRGAFSKKDQTTATDGTGSLHTTDTTHTAHTADTSNTLHTTDNTSAPFAKDTTTTNTTHTTGT